MSCSDCQRTLAIPSCVTNILLGSIAASTQVTVVLKNIATGYNHFFDVSSAADGKLTIDASTQSFSADQQYKLTVYKRDWADTLPITLDATPYDCLLVKFTRFYDSAGSKILTNVTLKIDE